MDEKQVIYNTILNNSEIYASLRLLTEQEGLSNEDIKTNLIKEIEFFTAKPYKIKDFYPSINHFLDYISMVKKLD